MSSESQWDYGLGVAWFDDPRLARDGVAVSERGVARFGTPTDLASDVVWLTNLGYATMRDAGLSRSPRFRAADYLRTTTGGMVGELGRALDAPEAQASAVLGIYRKVLAIAGEHLGFATPPRGTLSRGVRLRLGLDDALPEISREARYALRAATQSFTVAAHPSRVPRRRARAHAGAEDGTGEVHVVLRRHRQSHVRDLFEHPVPRGRWTRIPWAEGFRGDAALARAEAIAAERPAIFRVRVLGYRHPLIGEIINHGSGARDHREWEGARVVEDANLREWVSTPEFVLLSRHADLEVVAAMGAEDFAPPAALRCPWPGGLRERLLGSGAAAAIDYGVGLYLESLAGAFTRAGEGKVDPVATWLLALDRMLSFRAAIQVAASLPDGYAVTGYSRGRVWVRVPGTRAGALDEHHREVLARLAVDANLTPPVLSPAPAAGSARDALVLALGANTGQGAPVPPATIERMAAVLGRGDLLGVG